MTPGQSPATYTPAHGVSVTLRVVRRHARCVLPHKQPAQHHHRSGSDTLGKEETTSHRIGAYTVWTAAVATSAVRRTPRKGRVTPQLRDAMKAEVARPRGLGDPLDVIRGVTETLSGLEREADKVAVRHRGIRTLRRKGWSYDRLAEATGMSKSRIQQLVGQARTGTPAKPAD